MHQLQSYSTANLLNDSFVKDSNFTDVSKPIAVAIVLSTAFVAGEDCWREIAIVNISNHAVQYLEIAISIKFCQTMTESRPRFVTVTHHLNCISRNHFDDTTSRYFPSRFAGSSCTKTLSSEIADRIYSSRSSFVVKISLGLTWPASNSCLPLVDPCYGQ